MDTVDNNIDNTVLLPYSAPCGSVSHIQQVVVCPVLRQAKNGTLWITLQVVDSIDGRNAIFLALTLLYAMVQ